MKIIAFFCALALAPAALSAGNAFFVYAGVQSQVDAQGMGADACQYAGATLVRENFLGEPAFQVAGMYPNDPSRLFTKPGQGTYVLTDVGNQWIHSLSQNQVFLGFFETEAGQHGWNAASYAGASRQTLTKPSLVVGQMEMPVVMMTRLPQPSLLQASPSSICLQIPGSIDPSGFGVGFRVWRRRADLSGDPWATVKDIPWSTTAQTLTDTTVVADAPYLYGVSFSYQWLLGGGAGADPSVSGRYITNVKGLSNTLYASILQPTPTPFPTLEAAPATPSLGEQPWVAYPNPLVGSSLYLAFKTEKDRSQYWLTVYALDGTKVLAYQGEANLAGWQKPLINLNKLSSGIYLVRLRILQPGIDEKVLPVRKLAVIK